MPFSLLLGDISKVRADALVNAANPRLAPGGGVCGAIFAGAGHEKMLAACRAVGGCPTGDAVATPAFDLPARFVIHAVGPIWRGGSHGEREQLRSAYRSAFERASELACASIALPLISAGAYGYPADESMVLAREEAQRFLDDRPDAMVMLVLHERKVPAEGASRFRDIAAYIDEAQEGHRPKGRFAALPTFGVPDGWTSAFSEGEVEPRAYEAEALDGAFGPAPEPSEAPPAFLGAPRAAEQGPAEYGAPLPVSKDELLYLLDHLDASFSQTVLALIDRKGMRDTEVYKRANISRQLFAKLRKDNHYQPSKQTAVALAFALELSSDEADELLARAGFTLSRSSKFDLIVAYFLDHGCYDVFQLNEMLFAFDQPLVGSM